MNYRDPEALRLFLLDRIREKTELDKLDFKRTLNWSERGEKLALVGLINAVANTEAADHDNHGFLIYGMDRDDGRVTHHVPPFDDPGPDKLEAQITTFLRTLVQPVPSLSVYRFMEEGVGTWGAIVIWPERPAPFVFIKDGDYKDDRQKSQQLWRRGEWKVRLDSNTAAPTVGDYQRVIAGYTAPLRQEIEILRHDRATLSGQVSVHESALIPELTLIPQTLTLAAVSSVLAWQRSSVLKHHVAQLRRLYSALDALTPTPRRTPNAPGTPDLSAFEIARQLSSLTRPLSHGVDRPAKVAQDRIESVRSELKSIGIASRPAAFVFDQLYSRTNPISFDASTTYVGPDLGKFQQLRAIEDALVEYRHDHAELKRAGPCVAAPLVLENRSSAAVEIMTVIVRLKGDQAKLLRYLPTPIAYRPPRPPSMLPSVMLGYEPPTETPPLSALHQENIELTKALLRPGDSWALKLAIHIMESGEATLEVEVKAKNLRQPFRASVALHLELEGAST